MWRTVLRQRAAPVAAGVVVAAAAACGGGPVAAQQVVLPLAQYEELREKARAAPEQPPPPPAPFALEGDDLEVIAGPTSARIVQTLAVRVLSADWQTIPIGDAGSFVGADLGGLEGRVEHGPGGAALRVRGEGEHRLRLESVVPVAADAAATRPTWRFALRLPETAVARGALAAPAPLAGTVEEAAIDTGGLLEDGAPGGPWRFAAMPGKQLQFRLLGRAVLPERARLALRFETTAATSAVLSHTRLRVHGWVVARVAQGRLAELRLRLPEGLAVENVGGASVAGWKVIDGSLVVTPLEPVEETLAVAVELTGPPKDAFAAPLLLPQGALRTTLLARAALQGDGLLEMADPGATRPPDAVETAPLGTDPAAGSGKLYLVADPARPPRWQATWAERTAVLAAQVDDLWVEVAAGQAGRASYQLWAEVRNRGTAQLKLVLPAGFELEVASRDGLPLALGVTADQGLAVPLLSRDAPQLVHLAGLLPLTLPHGAGPLAVPLPALSAPAARIDVRVLLPGDRSYALADPTRAVAGAAMPPAPANAAAVAPGAPRPGDLAAQLLLRPAEAPPLDSAAASGLPAGFVEIAASWSALSAAPAPLAIKVTARKEREPWF